MTTAITADVPVTIPVPASDRPHIDFGPWRKKFEQFVDISLRGELDLITKTGAGAHDIGHMPSVQNLDEARDMVQLWQTLGLPVTSGESGKTMDGREVEQAPFGIRNYTGGRLVEALNGWWSVIHERFQRHVAEVLADYPHADPSLISTLKLPWKRDSASGSSIMFAPVHVVVVPYADLPSDHPLRAMADKRISPEWLLHGGHGPSLVLCDGPIGRTNLTTGETTYAPPLLVPTETIRTLTIHYARPRIERLEKEKEEFAQAQRDMESLRNAATPDNIKKLREQIEEQKAKLAAMEKLSAEPPEPPEVIERKRRERAREMHAAGLSFQHIVRTLGIAGGVPELKQWLANKELTTNV